MLSNGLDDVIAAATRLSHVDGEAGTLIIGGFPLEALADHASFEETVWLLWNGDLPTVSQLDAFKAEMAASRDIPQETVTLLARCAAKALPSMDALQMAIGTLPDRDRAVSLLAAIPTIIAAYARLRRGATPVTPTQDLGHASNYLYMLSGDVPHHEHARALETYLNTVVDHGLNASTFTARVITSTGADLLSAVVGALGALKGPLHGGAPGPALDMVFEIGEAAAAERVLRAKLEAGERLMGFGHRIYRVRDPRADVLERAAERLFTRAGDLSLYVLTRSVEQTALRLLEEYKPGRRLQTNVEFYTALLLHGLGLDTDLFTPTFAASRAAGWIGHAFEQRAVGRIIRPKSAYVGPVGRSWVPAGAR